MPAPEYLRLTPVGLEEDEKYNYDRPELWEYIQYLPDPIAQSQFYVPWMTSNYEKALAENYRRILKHGRTNQMKKLNHSSSLKSGIIININKLDTIESISMKIRKIFGKN